MPTDGEAVPRIMFRANAMTEFSLFISGTALPSVGITFLTRLRLMATLVDRDSKDFQPSSHRVRSSEYDSRGSRKSYGQHRQHRLFAADRISAAQRSLSSRTGNGGDAGGRTRH